MPRMHKVVVKTPKLSAVGLPRTHSIARSPRFNARADISPYAHYLPPRRATKGAFAEAYRPLLMVRLSYQHPLVAKIAAARDEFQSPHHQPTANGGWHSLYQNVVATSLRKIAMSLVRDFTFIFRKMLFVCSWMVAGLSRIMEAMVFSDRP